ncbi:ribonuclease H [Trifolium pratense]|uniref:Ribonuclease H n=1 Tax=Trifolium pratense TaxID=57577 RepID=A0A2K3NZU3_TRIPR|nr:ribonuclease H [Trifolium pratense]
MDNSENVESCEVPISENYMNDATEGLDDVSMNDATSCDSGGMKRRHIYGLFADQAGDSLQSVNLIREGVSAHHRFANEVFSIRQLLTRDWEVAINHTLREGNACADALAKMGALSDSSLVKISTPPSDLSMLLLADAQGIVFIRE